MARFSPHAYQQRAFNLIINNPRAALWLDMGLGKTVVTLAALKHLKNKNSLGAALVVAPLRVARDTWTDELSKWSFLNGLTASVVIGTAKQRMNALSKKADIYLINREMLLWLAKTNEHPLFDVIVLDESTSYKNPTSGRFKAAKFFTKSASRVIELTGTPAPNGYLDLWAQMFLLDGGKRLGKTIGAYRNDFFNARLIKPTPYPIFEYDLKLAGKTIIDERLSDICFSMRAADYLDLPPCVVVDIPVILSKGVNKAYKALERSSVVKYLDGSSKALDAASVVNKLLQFTNGAIYDPNGTDWEAVHADKLEVLDELYENVKPLIVFYSFRFDLERLRERYHESRTLDTTEDLRDWQSGKIPMLLLHPASAGHGLNLQSGGNNVAWFGLPWSLELYEQANKRLDRQGQTKPVNIYRLIAKGTIDEYVVNVLEAKGRVQDALIDLMKDLEENYE